MQFLKDECGLRLDFRFNISDSTCSAWQRDFSI